MKAAMVILGTVEEQQAAGDHELIDPTVIDLAEWRAGGRGPSPVFAGGQYRVPEDVIGWWTNPRVEDGRLVVDVETDSIEPANLNFSFAGLAAGGQARLIAVHAHAKKGS